MKNQDLSNGYEAIAERFMAARSATGCDVVQKWAALLPKGATVLDIGAGSGEPITSALVAQGLEIFAIDAAPTMVAAFRRRFPDIPIVCEPAERSRLFDRQFDAILMVGLIFLLTPDRQEHLLRRLGPALKPKGRLLFSAPRQKCSWDDVLTQRPSSSLGRMAYERILAEGGIYPLTHHVDQGGSYYYDCRKH